MALYAITTRIDGETLTAAKYNADGQLHADNNAPTSIEDYSADLAQSRTQTSPATLATDLAGEFARLRYQLALIAGVTNWDQAGALARVFGQDVILTDVVNTTVETTVFSLSIPGGTLGTTKALRLSLIGDVLNNSGVAIRTLTTKIKYGGVTLHSCTLSTLDASASRRALVFDVLLAAANSTALQYSRCHGMLGGLQSGNSDMQAAEEERYGVHAGSAIDSAVTQLLEVTFKWSAAHSGLSARALAVFVEILP
jgi:hypothetical protein